MTKKLINKMTYVPNDSQRESGPWKSQTVPDEALGIKEIYSRYARNEPLGGKLMGTMDSYSDTPQDRVSLNDPDLMELARMDITDRAEYMETLQETIQQRKAEIKAAQEALLRKQEAHAAVEADIKAFELEQAKLQVDPKTAKKAVKKPVQTPPKDE